MNIIKKFRKSEKGSITVMVLSAMLFLIGTITVSYFAMSNKSIDQDKKVGEEVRMKYRYLDLRKERMQKNLTLRHDIFFFTRDFFICFLNKKS